MKADRESALFSPDAAMLESSLVEESRMKASGICHRAGRHHTLTHIQSDLHNIESMHFISLQISVKLVLLVLR